MFKQKHLFFLRIILCLIVSTQLSAQVQTPRYTVVSNNLKAFYEYLPAGYPAAGLKYPLLIFLHGAGETGQGTSTSLPLVLRHGPPKLINNGTFPASFTVNGQTRRFIVLSPQFVGWPGVGDINSLINLAMQQYAVDPNRIYLTGLSMGGGAVWDYAGFSAVFSNRIAAIIPICGADAPNQAAANIMASANIAVWATHNNGDGTVSVANTNSYISLINSAPTPPNPLARKTIFPVNGHDAWSTTYNPTYKENGLNVYEWMLQYSRNLNVLPVTGLNLQVQPTATKKVALSWQTISETNNAGFEILRSSDGAQFSQAGYVNSSSVNGEGASYSFVDNQPLAGKSFYRLKMTDRTGEYSFSDIKIIQLNTAADIQIFPNPVKDILSILSGRRFENAQLRILNATGQAQLQQTLNGSGSLPVNVAKLTPGLYILEIIERNRDIVRQPFIKQ